jgi:predicted secreted protein
MVRSWRRAGVVVVAAVAVVGTAACGSSSGSSSSGGTSVPTSAITPEPGSTVDVKVGKPFVIVLATNPSTGFEWAVKQSPANVQFQKSDTEDPKSGRVGAPGTQLLTFNATGPGTGPMNLIYDRPTAPTVPAKSLTFTVRATK